MLTDITSRRSQLMSVYLRTPAQTYNPTVSLGVTSVVAYTYGCDDGRIEPSVTVLSRVKPHAPIAQGACIAASERRGESAPGGHGTANNHGDHRRDSS